MKKIILWFVLSISFISYSQNETTLYIGTYTDGESEGIYKMPFNETTGNFGALQVVAKTTNPSYLAYSPNKKYVYAVGEINNFKNETSGFVSAYKVTEDGFLQLLNTVSSKGAHPCHISIDSTGKKAVVSNYTGGTVALFSINIDGSLGEANQVFNHNTTTETSHAHSAQFYKDRLFVADLGRNAVFEYKNTANTYKLVTPSIVPIENNSGPRHFALTKNGDFMYIINEYANTITLASKKNDVFKFIGSTSTLDSTHKAESFSADIHLSKNEEFLYGSNRGENSIVVFKRNLSTGNINKIQTSNVQGNWPRNFTLSPNGKFLLVANQKSENISVFKVHKNSGKLFFLQSIHVPTPVYLLFK
tara:strand:+ start:6819 stop:7901 length:1083 start_codon:yes stop_codon:yes gene_type:complete